MSSMIRPAPALLALLALLPAPAPALNCGFPDSRPSVLSAPRTDPTAITVDGRLDEAAWATVPWSQVG